MKINNDDIIIDRVKEHWEVYINGEFFCSADTHLEAVNEVYKFYGIEKEDLCTIFITPIIDGNTELR